MEQNLHKPLGLTLPLREQASSSSLNLPHSSLAQKKHVKTDAQTLLPFLIHGQPKPQMHMSWDAQQQETKFLLYILGIKHINSIKRS